MVGASVPNGCARRHGTVPWWTGGSAGRRGGRKVGWRSGRLASFGNRSQLIRPVFKTPRRGRWRRRQSAVGSGCARAAPAATSNLHPTDRLRRLPLSSSHSKSQSLASVRSCTARPAMAPWSAAWEAERGERIRCTMSCDSDEAACHPMRCALRRRLSRASRFFRPRTGRGQPPFLSLQVLERFPTRRTMQ